MESRRKEEWQRGSDGKEEGSVVDISVVGDGGWGKRSLGHGYNSLTGMCYYRSNN